MTSDSNFDLERLVTAQAPVFITALNEFKGGAKAQPLDVVRLPADARAGALHRGPALRHRLARRGACLPRVPPARIALVDCTHAVLAIEGRSSHAIFGSPDDIKFCSSMTLSSLAADD